MKKTKDLFVYLHEVLECCDDIQSYVSGYTRTSFVADKKTQDAVIRKIEIIGEICSKNGAVDTLITHGSTNRERLWEFRRCMYEAGNARSILSRSLDPVVPRMKIPEFVHEINSLKKNYGFDAACFGHAGDGNVHVIMFPGKFSEEEWTVKYPEICKAVYKKAVDLGGKIAAEHGIGVIRKSYLKIAIGEAQLELLKSAKKAFDPKNIMNPGKIFDL